MTATSPALTWPRPAHQLTAPSCSKGLPEAAKSKIHLQNVGDLVRALGEGLLWQRWLMPDVVPRDSPPLAEHPEEPLMSPRAQRGNFCSVDTVCSPSGFFVILDAFASLSPTSGPERQPTLCKHGGPTSPALQSRTEDGATAPSRQCHLPHGIRSPRSAGPLEKFIHCQV